ncbi:LuxR C-terminal-related transcriptional regulator [Streptomyces pinistramenti]|uniref:LuxR C-terminal-related transcriptional regulator n=1 Tax=Streptomyces pinistramenti TaxID=2884812 RepID=UPI001D099201|nr:LuxR C-terminal-related transcriptional regulator [Streptomyces pinistramenti]MCB5910846.1 LuxR C-terminal-related transcriptional regulator [Streptomyces pinistramenti]
MDALVNECSATGEPSMELTSAELASYQRIAEQGPVRVGEMTAGTQGDVSVPAVDNLIAAGLVRRLGTDRLAAVDPASVSDQLLEKWEERVRGAQFDLLWMRSQFAELKLIYATQKQPAQGPQLERIDSHEELVRTLERHAAECRREVLSARPGGARQDAELLETRHRYQSLLGRDVRLRTLYQYSTRFDALTAQEAIESGAEVRTVTGDLARFIIFDRTVLFIPLQDEPGGGALVVRNSDLVTFAAEMFHSLWLTGELLHKPRERTFIQDLTNQTKQSILQHLIDGADDRTTARALGISVRTCQRHVSEMMRQLGASSRLQLGFLLREQEQLAL